MEPWEAERERQRGTGWSPGQAIFNGTGAREPAHTFHEPVPITARIVWADDGEEYIETVAAGWTARDVYVLPGSRRSLASGGVDMFGVRVHGTP